MPLEIMLFFLALLGSIAFLCWAGAFAVHHVLEIATVYNVSTLFGGFILMAISTGIPEFSVALTAALGGVAQVSAGDIIGSNVVDITLVLGAVTLFAGKLTVDEQEYPNIIMLQLIAMLAMGIVFFLGVVTKLSGLFLVFLYFVCLWWIYKTGIAAYGEVTKVKAKEKEFTEPTIPLVEEKVTDPFWHSKFGVALKFCFSMTLVLIAARFVVYFALRLSETFGMSLETVGTSIIAIGTSLPELALGLHAVRRKEHSLALGNSLGSVLVQGTFILGLLALLSPQPISLNKLRLAVPFMFVAFGTIGYGLVKRRKLNRIEGVILLTTFFGFLLHQVVFVR